MNAARFVVGQCVKQNRLQELRMKYPDAVLIPVLGANKIPLALAQEIGLPIWLHVRLIHTVSRKVLNAIQRLLHKPLFAGFVKRGDAYILVDDVVTQGGTISALREFVMVHGGRVVAVVALAFAIGSHAVAPMKGYVVRLFVKFGSLLERLLQMLGVTAAFRGLTNAQARYLLRFASVRNIIKRITQIEVLLT
jgi:hypothetical protein